MRSLLQDAAERAARYLETLDGRPVFPRQDAIDALARLDHALPDTPTDPAAVLALMDEVASPATTAMAGRRYFGFVIGGSLPASVAANMLSVAWDNATAMRTSSPAGIKLEDIALKWARDLLQLPPESMGAFVTGATMANFTALAAARHAVLEWAGWDLEFDGMFGAPPITVIAGEEVHASVLKGIGMLGLGRNRLIKVPTDDQGRMRADLLPDTIQAPAIVILQAGNVNTGASDPFEQIIPRVKQDGVWVHVDGAFGLWAAASPRLEHLVKGVQLADSWATDAHKWLNVPYDSGIVFTRHPAAHRAAVAQSAAYYMRNDRVGEPAFYEPVDYTPETSRRGRGIDAWAAMLSLGKSGLIDLFERTCDHAQTFAAALKSCGFEIIHEVVLNQVMVRFGDDQHTQKVIQAVQQEGTMWAGSTVWKGRTAMRISVSSWATTADDVERSIDAITRAAQTV